MPLPHITKKRTWKSCNAIQLNNNNSTVILRKSLYAATNKKLKMSQLKNAAHGAAEINGLRKLAQNGLRKTRSSDSRNLDTENAAIAAAMAAAAAASADFNNAARLSPNGLRKIRSSESRNLETPILWKRLHKSHKNDQNSSKIHTHLVNTSRSNSTAVIKVEQRGP